MSRSRTAQRAQRARRTHDTNNLDDLADRHPTITTNAAQHIAILCFISYRHPNIPYNARNTVPA